MSENHSKRIVVWVQHFGDRPHLMLQWHDPDTGKRKSMNAETRNPLDAEKARRQRIFPRHGRSAHKPEAQASGPSSSRFGLWKSPLVEGPTRLRFGLWKRPHGCASGLCVRSPDWRRTCETVI
jgi:hypothetical protein